MLWALLLPTVLLQIKYVNTTVWLWIDRIYNMEKP